MESEWIVNRIPDAIGGKHGLMIKALDHVNIVVSDLQKAKNFFMMLGFTLEHEGELQGEWILTIVGLENIQAEYARMALPGSQTRLELMSYQSPASGRDPLTGKANRIGIRHIAFEVDDIDRVITQLRRSDVELVGSAQTYELTGKKLVYFYGPDGILLELAQYKN